MTPGKPRATANRSETLGWKLFLLAWIPFLGIFSYVFYPVDQWLPPVSYVCLIIFVIMMVCAMTLLVRSSIGVWRKQRRTGAGGIIVREGVPAQAIITAIADSGTRINDQFVLDIGLQVTPAFGPAFATQVTQTIPIFQMARIQKGMTVPVRYLEATRETAIFFE